MPTLAVSEIKKENLTVYPNPTSDYVYWAGGKADVKVYDLAGNCIKDLTEVESVSLEGLASGMYIVSVSCCYRRGYGWDSVSFGTGRIGIDL